MSSVSLHVFENSETGDYVVAMSVKDAWACVLAMWGGEMAEYGELDDFVQLPDDRELAIYTGEYPGDGGETLTKTCAEWARENGRRFLAGSET